MFPAARARRTVVVCARLKAGGEGSEHKLWDKVMVLRMGLGWGVEGGSAKTVDMLFTQRLSGSGASYLAI